MDTDGARRRDTVRGAPPREVCLPSRTGRERMRHQLRRGLNDGVQVQAADSHKLPAGERQELANNSFHPVGRCRRTPEVVHDATGARCRQRHISSKAAS